jgi:hypothetical protein
MGGGNLQLKSLWQFITYLYFLYLYFVIKKLIFKSFKKYLYYSGITINIMGVSVHARLQEMEREIAALTEAHDANNAVIIVRERIRQIYREHGIERSQYLEYERSSAMLNAMMNRGLKENINLV